MTKQHIADEIRRLVKPNEFCVTIVCDGLHPDDVEELQRVLVGNRYAFKVEIDQNVQAEHYPELNVIRIRTKLFVRFSAKWFSGRTRQGGVRALVKTIDEVLDRSTHSRDRRPQVSFDSNGQELITTETWLRPRTKKHSWTRDHKLALGILMLTGVAALAAIFVVPEFRRFFHLDKPELTQQATPEKQSTPSMAMPAAPIQSTEPSKPSEVLKPKTPKVTQKTTTHVTGNNNVAGNNVSGDHNVTGNNNQTGATANAPNGIAIVGPATVTNPTVNNFGPSPKNPAVVTVCVGEPQTVTKDAGHDGEFRQVLTLTTDSSVDNPTYGFQFSGTILSKGSASSSPDMAMNVKEGVTTPTSFAFVIYQTWYPGQRINVEVYSREAVNLVKALGKHSESFTVKNGDCNSSL